MIDEHDYSNLKYITMTASSPDGQVTLSQTYDNDTAWPKISQQFYKFLAGMGYVLDSEATGADWEI